jgi:large subunit ribosomal protein L35
MPKLKTKRSAAKRFSLTGSGKVRRNRAGRRHILTKKSQKRKRQLRGTIVMRDCDVKIVKACLPYG